MPAVNPEDAFTVNFPSVATASEAIFQATKIIDDITDQLEGNAERSLSYWVDTAQEQYVGAKRTWDIAINEMTKVLGGAGTVLNEIHDNYRRTEVVNASAWEK